MLLLLKIDLISKKRGGKLNLVWPSSSSGGKIIFALLAKFVTLHMSPSIIDVKELSHKFILR